MAGEYGTSAMGIAEYSKQILAVADAIENAPTLLSVGSLAYRGAAGNSSHSNSGSGGTTGCGSNSRSDRTLEEMIE